MIRLLYSPVAAGLGAGPRCVRMTRLQTFAASHSRNPSRISYTVGITSNVSSVEVMTPPITARPSGARKSAPSP